MTTHPWKSKTALICGASDGLGKALARQLCVQSIEHLGLVARNEQRLSESCKELRSAYPRASIVSYTADMSDIHQVRKLAKEIAQSSPPADLLIQAVGQSDRGTLADLNKERMLELFDTNLFTSLNAINELTCLMKNPSALVLIGSLASHFAPRFMGGYAIAKHALAALAQQSRLELAERGIHVMLASPGPIQRSDAGTRYQQQIASANIPADAFKPGGGAKIKGLAVERLAKDILSAAARRKTLCVYPMKANLLRMLMAIAPAIGDRLLRNNSS
jgi:uncharacterized protein